MTSSDDPYAPHTQPVAPGEAPLARVPKAPRVPSPSAEALLKDLDAKDKGSVIFGCVWLAFLFFPVILVLHSGPQGSPPASVFLAIAPFLLVGILVLGSGYRGLRARRPTFASGTPVIGTVTTLVTNRGSTTLRWTFTDETGRPFNGSLSTRQPALLGERFRGSAADIVVLYDPMNPKRNIVWLD
jgi:hypothetical protein